MFTLPLWACVSLRVTALPAKPWCLTLTLALVRSLRFESKSSDVKPVLILCSLFALSFIHSFIRSATIIYSESHYAQGMC